MSKKGLLVDNSAQSTPQNPKICKRGHAIIGNNILYHGAGYRRCRECVRLRSALIPRRKRQDTPLDKTERQRYSSLMEGIMNETIELNHVCCVCQASLDGKPFNPELKTSHGYCDPCLEAELLKIGGQS